MADNLKNRSFLKLLDFTPEEIRFLLGLSADLKKAKYAGTEQPRLSGKNIVLIFEKDSTRTRCAFETAAYDQGANVTYLGPTGSQIGKKPDHGQEIDHYRLSGRHPELQEAEPESTQFAKGNCRAGHRVLPRRRRCSTPA